MIIKSSSFVTDDNLKVLAELETVFADGTFHNAQYQIFIVHALKIGQQFSLAYCLLFCSFYQQTFILLKEKAEELLMCLHLPICGHIRLLRLTFLSFVSIFCSCMSSR